MKTFLCPSIEVLSKHVAKSESLKFMQSTVNAKHIATKKKITSSQMILKICH